MLHLFHPALVHFSVALLVLGGGAEVWGLAARNGTMARWGERVLLMGLVSLLPTIVSGYLAANTVELPEEAAGLLDSHERNGLILLGVLLLIQFWKAWCGGRLAGAQQKIYAVLLLGVVALTIYSAWLGGQMVYGYGIGVR